MTARAYDIRRGLLEDVDGILALEQSIPRAPHWNRDHYLAIFARAPGTPHIRRCLFVAVHGEQILGFAVASISRFGEPGLGEPGLTDLTQIEGELESVAVTPEMLRRGVGRRLTEATLLWCRERGVEVIELEVRAGNLAALALYRSVGFCEAGRRPGYYALPREDALTMRIDLHQERPTLPLAHRPGDSGPK